MVAFFHGGVLSRNLAAACIGLRAFVALAGFPQDLAENSKSEFGIGSGKPQTVNEAADFIFGRSCGALVSRTIGTGFQITAGTQGVEQEHGKALEVGSGSWCVFFRFPDGFRVTRKFIEANGDCLPKIHGSMLFARGDTDEPMAVAQVFV